MNSLGNLESNIYRDAGIRPEGAAMMILLKYYMIRGKFQQAESLCRELMEMEDRVYTLQADYNYIFSKEGWQQHSSVSPLRFQWNKFGDEICIITG